MESIFDYINSLSVDVMNGIFGATIDSSKQFNQSPWACKAIFQSLSILAKHYVVRLLFIDKPIESQEFLNWITLDKLTEHQHAIDDLIKLKVLSCIPKIDDKSSDHYIVNTYFKVNLKYAICHPVEPWSDSTPNKAIDEPIPTVEVLNRYCREKWENVLLFLVKGEVDSKVSSTLVSFLQSAGLMQADTERKGCLSITSSGYEYMLKDMRSQVWIYIYEILHQAGRTTTTSHQIEILLFLFMLSFCEVGKAYPVKALSETQQRLLYDFYQLGIIYLPSPSSKYFYPTAIAISIVSSDDTRFASNIYPSNYPPSSSILPLPSSAAGTVDGHSKNTTVVSMKTDTNDLSVIVQTNFQVVAYLTSTLHLAMLSLFVDFRIRLPNMAVGTITRASVKEAYRIGITALQILNFLRLHSHMKGYINNENQIPENVSDQLYLWENEKNRIIATSAVYVNVADMASGDKLERTHTLLVNHAKAIGILLWEDTGKKCFVVSSEGFQQLSHDFSSSSFL